MKKLLIPCFALASLIMACNGSQTSNTTTDSSDNNNTAMNDTAMMVNTDHDTMAGMRSDSMKTDFVADAATGGMMEVQLGELAKTHAQSQAVKDFGAMMVRDHTKANDELKSIAAKNNVNLPTALTDKQRDHVDDLSKKNGEDFDKDYMKMMVDDHESDIKMFERCAKDEDEKSDVKAFAGKTLPVLYKHLDAAKKIRDAQKSK
jgi:putative membrane protein